MVFSSILFIFRFLPIFLILYFAAPGRTKNPVLLVGSLFFYAWGEPVYISLMIFSTVLDYSTGRLAAYGHATNRAGLARLGLCISVCANLGLLAFFKYSGAVALPIGISFYTFQTMSYTIDCYRKEIKPEKNFLDFAVYVTLFPQLIAGPIVKYRDVSANLHNRRADIDKISYGCKRFVYGLAKKVLLANNIGLIWNEISSMNYQTLPTFTAWIGIVAFALQIYFDFSGYSDMAIGLGAILGFDFPENFNYPYISKSITEFWRRWHMTLGSWFREYVYIPLGGNKKGLRRQLFNIPVVWMLTGIWHGAGWNFACWGLWFAIWLLLEKTILLRLFEKVPNVFRHAYTLLIVLVSWTFFEISTGLSDFLRALFHLNGADFFRTTTEIGSSYDITRFYLNENLVIFTVALIAATPVTKTKLWNKIMTYIEIPMLVVLFILSVAYIVDASYNPFLYFRF